MLEQWNDLLMILTEKPLNALFLILGILLLEVILSFDNAAVLATMVKDLPVEQQSKALRYGILGAYVFRGVALVLVEHILEIWWLKPIGGLYLLWMAVSHFAKNNKKDNAEEVQETKKSVLYRSTVGLIGVFWSTVLAVEFMDIVFSIDNIFAVVAYTPNIYIICIGVFIGILAMRYVAKYFVVLMEKYPFLEKSAFLVIGILGLKLCFSLMVHLGESNFSKGNIQLYEVENNRLIEDFNLEKSTNLKNIEGDLVINVSKLLDPNTDYKFVLNNVSQDVLRIDTDENNELNFTTGKKIYSNKKQINSSYPYDNSKNIARKLKLVIKNNNKFKWIESEEFDLFISVLTLMIFFIPIVSKRFFIK